MRVLLLSSDAKLREELAERLGAEGHLLSAAGGLEEAVGLLAQQRFDAAISDVGTEAGEGVKLLRRIRSDYRDIPVLVIGAAHSSEIERQALREGAFDCARRPLEPDLLIHRLRQASERERLRSELGALRALLGSSTHRDDFVAEGERMRRLVAAATEVARRGTAALITGEAGAGKTALARSIHRLAGRGELPLLSIDCEAPGGSAEHELFAGNGSGRSVRTLLEHGAVVLESIDALPESAQSRLDEVLAEGERPIIVTVRGGNGVDQRLCPALRVRLERHHLRLPPLRERPEEIPALLAHFVQAAARRLRRPVSVTPDALTGLRRYAWPENVRELESAVERAAVLAGDRRIELADFGLPGETTVVRAGSDYRLKPQVETFEAEVIRRALDAAGGSRRNAAKLLGVSLRTLFYKLRRHGFESTSAKAIAP